MLKQRVITALVLAALMLAAMFGLSNAHFAMAIGGMLLIGAWEWSNLMSVSNPLARIAYVLVIATCMYIGFELRSLASFFVPLILVVAVIFWLAYASRWVLTYPKDIIWHQQIILAPLGIVVLVPAWLGLVDLQGRAEGPWYVLFTIAVVASADIGAFFTGRAFGKNKLAPAVSPGKSWEGFFGGLASSIVLALITASMLHLGGFRLIGCVLLVAATAVVSVLGDLFESMLKRQRGIKDSGWVLPGHGGVLDRLDSLSAAIPLFALGIWLAGGV
ncbi:MAG TPA: phosphatidate cytidylyltransferase [Pseudomonadales bacterium]|nr:phosphatidate cytidylyltransferase [Pseudomonadales bacterium]